MGRFQEIAVKQEIVVLGGDVMNQYDLCIREDEKNKSGGDHECKDVIEQNNNNNPKNESNDQKEIPMLEGRTVEVPKSKREMLNKKTKKVLNETRVDLCKQWENLGKEWEIHPVGICAKNLPRFVTYVKKLCKWIIKQELNTTLDAVFVYIRSELQHLQFNMENSTMYHQFKADNQKRWQSLQWARTWESCKLVHLQDWGTCKTKSDGKWEGIMWEECWLSRVYSG